MYFRIRKVLENKSNTEEDRVAVVEAQLAQAKLIAEEADKKYEEVKNRAKSENFSRHEKFSRQKIPYSSTKILLNKIFLYLYLAHLILYSNHYDMGFTSPLTAALTFLITVQSV